MTQAVAIACPHCGAKLRLNEAPPAEKKIRCPKCEQSFAVGDAPVKQKKKSDAPPPLPPSSEEQKAEKPAETGAKKKKKKKKKASGPSRQLLIGGGVLAFVVVAGVVFLLAITLRGMKGTPMTAPAEFANYNSAEGVFSIDHPVGWDEEAGGVPGKYFCRYKKSGATLQVKQSLVGSLMGDIAKSGDGDEGTDSDLETVARVHETRKEDFIELQGYTDYAEQKMEPFACGFGKSRR
ncbi:MAG: zinc-ribbon domain-containing protein, partial [Planctomycetia bacterium]